jgi:hypothetical protein
LREPWSIIAQTNIFEGRNKPQFFVQAKLFQATRQDDLRFSDCTVFLQILDDADVAFRISGTKLRTVLSATTMLADGPHRLKVC